ncbi:MAG TPA: hypothetical protein VGB63_11480 [Pedobacter sp.]|jgi:hypothetical protein
MPGFAKKSTSKFSYSDIIELSIYSDLKTALRPNSRILLNTNEESIEVEDMLTNLNIPFIIKSKRELWVVAEVE